MNKPVVPFSILQQHVAVLGKTRSGKSSVMRGLVERLIEEGKPVCIVDPKGDWWGIKLAADGKHEGLPVVIFGGEHADIPIDEHSGHLVAELFATGNRSCLIDLGGWTVGSRTRFWIDFASTLFKLTKGNRWLVVDEIHNFAPKGKVFDAEAGKALHWTNRLASEGLGKGLAMLFASQRPQKVHNDTLTSAETLIAMRVIHPSDRGAVSEWIKGCGDSEGDEVLGSLAQMLRGEGWAWSPEIGFGPKRVQFPMFKTYDSFRPQTAEDAERLTGWADVDLDEIRAKFAATIEKAKAEDPKELKKQIAELRRQLAGRDTGKLDQDQVARIQDVAYQRGYDAGTQSRADEVKALDREVVQLRKTIEQVHGLTQLEERTTLPAAHKTSPSPPKTPAPVHEARQSVHRTAPIVHGSAGAVSGAERKLLTVLAQYPGGKEITALAHLSGYTVNGHFNNLLGSLRSKGYAQRGNPVLITSEGFAALGDFEPLPTGEDLRNYWRNKVSGAERRLLEPLLDAYPNGLTIDELAAAAGYTVNGHFNNLLGHLRTIELVTRGNPVRASDTLFE